MRTLHKTLASLGLLAMAGLGQLAACSAVADDCGRDGTCLKDGNPYRGGGAPPPGCENSPREDPDVIKDECGVFVSASAQAGGKGTKDSPFNTLQEAIDKAKETSFRVYACAETYDQEANVDSVSLFGGFDCAAEWSYVGGPNKRATIAPADGVPLRVSGGGNLKVEDVVAQAPDYAGAAPAALTAGKSSIAALVDTAKVAFARCDFEARNGQDGAAGESAQADVALDGDAGATGKDACTAGVDNPGAAAVTKMCPDGSTSVGGKGGDGGTIQNSPFLALAGGDGADGQPAATGGMGGLGEPEGGAGWTCSPGNGGGAFGEDGAVGGPGTGAAGKGTVDASGYVPASGMAGMPGTPGQGGGGGGGARGGQNVCGSTRAGASGGSGGSGGCGGKGGGGGLGGGASIALVSVNGTVVLTGCDLRSAKGGNGGAGGSGQPGGIGGDAGAGGKGSGTKSGCLGGLGGTGGPGGPGGGGAGGPSIGIAHVGAEPELGANVSITEGTGGLGGKDGTDGEANKGANGAPGKIVKF